METSNSREQEPFQTHCAGPVFGLWRAPVFPAAASQGGSEVSQAHDEEEHFTKAPKSLVHPLHKALLSAQEKIKKLTYEDDSLRRENARLTEKELGTHEALEKLTSLYTQVKTYKEEMEAWRNTMEEAFRDEKKAWQEERRKQLEEMKSFRMKLLVAQSHNHQMEEEVRESKREIQEGQMQAERELAYLRESLFIQREENAAIKDHWREVIREKEDSATKLKESEEKWQRRVSQLVDGIQHNNFVSSSIDKVIGLIGEQQNTLTMLNKKQSELCQSERKWERRSNALEESYRKVLAEKEESWQTRMQEMEKKIKLEKMWLQKEEEWRQKTSALEEEIKRLIKENTQLQGLTGKKKKRKPWWKRHFKLRRRTHWRTRGMPDQTPLLPQSQEK
ncbi:golgin subfamily A member 6-like protein 22 [Seriola aureovittata]|uniref:golgin subfamily A member 6-like protein 22 n=1 Tax=Seriola aureovittata TaxID=2871759 RepID=UPI0024BE4674|nr:golgin subfamily A member 6-like protein 22 [Seriola aureovittata]